MLLKKNPSIAGILIILAIMAAYIPALSIYLRTDDFVWLSSTYTLWKQPLNLFAPFGYFFRPMIKVSFLLNYTLFGTSTAFYALTTILIHLGNVFLLYTLILRISGRITLASLISLCFGASAMYSEITLWSAGRPDSIMLLFILGALVMVTGYERQLKRKYLFLLLIFGLGAAFSKETWVILPFLVLGLLTIIKRFNVKDALKHSAGPFFILLLYAIVFVVLPLLSGTRSPTDYASYNVGYSIKKTGYLLFQYVGAGELYSGEIWQVIAAFVALSGFGVLLFLQKNRLALWGLFWMILSMLPSLPIQGTPSRYNYLPLLGFWIMVIAFCDRGIEWSKKKFRIKKYLINITVIFLVLFYLSQQFIMLQWEIRDYKYLGDYHKRIVMMYEKIKPRLPLDQPTIFINAGTIKAVHDTSRAVQGYFKLLFVRKKGLWQLVLFAPLVNFAGKPFRYLMVKVPKKELGEVIKGKFTVVVFKDTGFFITEEFNEDLKNYYDTYRQLPERVQAYKFMNKKKDKGHLQN